jgi:DNA-binding transcriptional regulator YiaG
MSRRTTDTDHMSEADFAAFAQRRARAERNAPPVDIWHALQRLLNCNKTQLAAHLGVTPRTLRRWMDLSEQGENPGATATRHASDLLRATLSAAKADTHALPVNWDRISTIAGRR